MIVDCPGGSEDEFDQRVRAIPGFTIGDVLGCLPLTIVGIVKYAWLMCLCA